MRGLATARVNALDLPGPQKRGTLRQAQGRLGGTLNQNRTKWRPRPPAYMLALAYGAAFVVNHVVMALGG